MRVVECERAREYSSARGLACNAREYYTITTRVTCESLASHSRVSRESLASLSRVGYSKSRNEEMRNGKWGNEEMGK